VSSSADETTHWPPTENWQYPLKTVMVALKSGPSREPPNVSTRATVAHPWFSGNEHQLEKDTLRKSLKVVGVSILEDMFLPILEK